MRGGDPVSRRVHSCLSILEAIHWLRRFEAIIDEELKYKEKEGE